MMFFLSSKIFLKSSLFIGMIVSLPLVLVAQNYYKMDSSQVDFSSKFNAAIPDHNIISYEFWILPTDTDISSVVIEIKGGESGKVDEYWCGSLYSEINKSRGSTAQVILELGTDADQIPHGDTLILVYGKTAPNEIKSGKGGGGSTGIGHWKNDSLVQVICVGGGGGRPGQHGQINAPNSLAGVGDRSGAGFTQNSSNGAQRYVHNQFGGYGNGNGAAGFTGGGGGYGSYQCHHYPRQVSYECGNSFSYETCYRTIYSYQRSGILYHGGGGGYAGGGNGYGGYAYVNPGLDYILSSSQNSGEDSDDGGSYFKYKCQESFCPFVDRIYVDKDADPGGDGQTWSTAYNSLQDGLANDCNNVDIWVAEGEYKPGVLSTDKFLLGKKLTIYGGFSGAETSLDQRDWILNPTIISGDLNDNNIADAGDSHTLVKTTGGGTIINGVIFEYAFGDAANFEGRVGAGIFSENNLLLNNCIFRYLESPGITGNGSGGAIYQNGDSLIITNSIFHDNTSTGSGACIYINTGNLQIYNTTFEDNDAPFSSIYSGSSNSIIRNSIFWNNSGGSIESASGGNTEVSYSIIDESVIPSNVVDGGNILFNTDPEFIDPTSHDYRLSICSPAIDAGVNLLNQPTEDFFGNNRISNLIIDIGHVELHLDENPNVIFVDISATGDQLGSNWENAFHSLQDALAFDCIAEIDTILMAEGTYYTDEGMGITDNDQDVSFIISNPITIIGGYPSGGADTTNYELFETIISGDITQAVDIIDDSKHIFKINNTTTLQGLTIEHGGTAINNGLSGGAILATAPLTVESCIVRWTYSSKGSAISTTSDLDLLSNLFYRNQAGSGSGQGGVIEIATGSHLFLNNTFAYNYPVFGTIIQRGGTLDFTNNIVYSNVSTTSDIDRESGILNMDYNMINYGIPAGANDMGNNQIGIDPLFLNRNNYNFKLPLNSPALDAGNNVPNTSSVDVKSTVRILDSNLDNSDLIDIGAYEYKNICTAYNGVIYVDPFASSGRNNGLTWDDAYLDFHDALLFARECQIDTLKLAKGNYSNGHYIIPNGSVILGGYNDGNNKPRTPNTTITSLRATTLYSQAFWIEAGSDTTVIDGIYIENSSQNVAYGPIKFNNCTFRNNMATTGDGGALITGPNLATIINCIFQNNSAPSKGGAIRGVDLNISNTYFINNSNSLSTSYGSAIYSENNIAIENCIFNGNSTPGIGGAITAFGGTITNSLFYQNTSTNGNPGSVLYNTDDPMTISNSIIWGNDQDYFKSIGGGTITLDYNMIENGYAGSTNTITAEPMFFDTSIDNFRLRPCSPGVNEGLNSYNNSLLDLDNKDRILGIIDIGPYEYSGSINNYYVNQSKGSLFNDGGSYTEAHSNLQNILTIASTCPVDTIFIASGFYAPDDGIDFTKGDRDATFSIPGNVVLIGSINPDIFEQNLHFPTILSGNINNAGNITDNSKNVVILSGAATMDGFIIEDGYADNAAGIVGRVGAGLLTQHGGTFRNLGVRNNQALGFNNGVGGGIYASDQPISIENSLFQGNWSYNGGGLAIETSSGSTLKNVTITFNAGFGNGSGLHQYSSDVTITNSIIYNNLFVTGLSQEGGATTTISYSDIDGGYSGTGNIDEDPLFLNTDNRFFKPIACSPVVDAGDNSSAPSQSYDLFGNDRIVDVIDMGAYEYYSQTDRNGIALQIDDQQYSCPKNLEIPIVPSAIGATYTLLDMSETIIDGSVINQEKDLVLSSSVPMPDGQYAVTASKGGYHALSFNGSTSSMKIEYDSILSLRANENFTIQALIKQTNNNDRKRIYSQANGIGFGIDSSQLIFTKYGIVDVISTNLVVPAGTYTQIELKHKVISLSQVEIIMSVYGNHFVDTIPINFNRSFDDIYFGSTQSGVEMFEGEIEYIYISKGDKEIAMYDFVDGKYSEVARDYRIVAAGEYPFHATLDGFDYENDWIAGDDPFVTLCSEADTMTLFNSATSVSDTVMTVSDTLPRSLRYYIGRSCPNDTIRFASNLMGDTVKFDSQIFLNNNLFIEGLGMEMNGMILDGQGQTRLFDSPTGRTVTYKDLQLINGSHPFSGGAFPVPNDCTIWNVRFKGHNASGDKKAMSIGSSSSLKVKGEVVLEE